MVTKFKLNGKEVTAKEFDYNLMCDMEDIGFDLEDFGEKPLSALRGYVALCKNCTVEKAGKEISDHIAKGGNTDEVMEVMMNKLENSDFFQGQQENKTEKDTEN